MDGTVYAITSLDSRQADPALPVTWVRGHWSIEVRLHRIRDTAFAEDHSQVRTANGTQNLAALRTLAINALRLTGHTNVAAGLREHARTGVNYEFRTGRYLVMPLLPA